MRTPARLALLVAIAIALSSALAAPAAAIRGREVLGGLDAPVAFTFGPDGRIWYVEKTTGQVRIARPGGADRLFVDVPRVNGLGERGLLGIALHPRYPSRPHVYVYATRSVGGRLRNQILRYVDDGGSGVRRRVLYSTPASSGGNHNGGHIAFGPDGRLYAVVGDAGAPALSQNRRDERGKILRMRADGRRPRRNPFGNRVWAYGIRNSFGFAFDPRTGRLWETENGPECNDEINRIRRGGNYGWGPNETCSGAAPANTNQDGPDPILPRSYYANPIAVTGIAFCDGCRLGRASEGAAFHAASNDGRITRLRLNGNRTDVRRRTVVYDHPQGTLSVEVAPDGRIYFSDFDGIYVLRR